MVETLHFGAGYLRTENDTSSIAWDTYANMFRSLLTPLTARFSGSSSPSGSTSALPVEESITEEPEDFEYEERLDSMRVALDEVKMVSADNVQLKLQVRRKAHLVCREC